MKKNSGFIGILAILFFNIFFASSVAAETTKETAIIADENGIYQQNIFTEIKKTINWKMDFPRGFSRYCKERIINDYKEGKIKPGYSRNCDFTTTSFSLNPLGFTDVPIGENWQVIVNDKGVKFNLLPEPEIEKSSSLNNLGIFLFAISWFFLAGMNGYNGKSRKYLFGLFCLSPGVLYLLSIFSIQHSLLIAIVGLISMIIGVAAVFIIFSRSSFWLVLLFVVLMSTATVGVSFSGMLVSWLSQDDANNYMFFQLIVFAYSMSIREVVYAWRKEKLVIPKMVKAERKFAGHINEQEKEMLPGVMPCSPKCPVCDK